MDALTISAASGMRARMESLEMLANNIANQSAPGFKSDREFYSLYVAPEALEAAGVGAVPMPATLPVIERRWTDFSQGTLLASGNPLHLALSGRGFFQVQGPAGLLYTRDGSFQLSASGVLQTRDGYPVLDRDARPIRLDSTLPVEIAADGSVQQGGGPLTTIAVVDFQQPNVLDKQGGSYFRLSDSSLRAGPATAAEVHQGKLENANLAPAEAAVRLVSVLRQFEMLQKAVSLGAEMNRRSVEEVARVGS